IDIENIPTEAKTLALIVDDPDAPRGTFDHWIMWNISPDGKIKENSAPGVEGRNSAAENKYYAPCPPTGTHHYHFKVYALDTKLDLRDNADKGVLTEAMQGHVIGSGEIVGLYESKKVKRPPDRVNAEV
ncbi:MAG TPA: YbhB/YbcL family Raf kinase inhibitor-like protein, partial [Bacteroidia bacterium]|nr:YbhB/YbcL family Raf kinase inhibitor-like protein [Bacteroidia bacterium]